MWTLYMLVTHIYASLACKGLDWSPSAFRTDRTGCMGGAAVRPCGRLNSKHDTLNQCWFNVGPSATTLVQHKTSFGSMSRVSWDMSSPTEEPYATSLIIRAKSEFFDWNRFYWIHNTNKTTFSEPRPFWMGGGAEHCFWGVQLGADFHNHYNPTCLVFTLENVFYS